MKKTILNLFMLLESLLHSTDSVVYFTDIQILDSAKVSKEGFLAHRELYSYQLKNFLEDNQLQQNSTCMDLLLRKQKEAGEGSNENPE